MNFLINEKIYQICGCDYSGKSPFLNINDFNVSCDRVISTVRIIHYRKIFELKIVTTHSNSLFRINMFVQTFTIEWMTVHPKPITLRRLEKIVVSTLCALPAFHPKWPFQLYLTERED